MGASRTRATRLKLTCLHVGAADSLWTRSLMPHPWRTPTSLSEGENETAQVEGLLGRRWEFATPAALLHFLLICEVMGHEIYSPAVKMTFSPSYIKDYFDLMIQVRKANVWPPSSSNMNTVNFFFSFYRKEKVQQAQVQRCKKYEYISMPEVTLKLFNWKFVNRNTPACYYIISLSVFAHIWLYCIPSKKHFLTLQWKCCW